MDHEIPRDEDNHSLYMGAVNERNVDRIRNYIIESDEASPSLGGLMIDYNNYIMNRGDESSGGF